MGVKTKAPTKAEVRNLLRAVRDVADRLEVIAKLRPTEVQQLHVDACRDLSNVCVFSHAACAFVDFQKRQPLLQVGSYGRCATTLYDQTHLHSAPPRSECQE